MENASLIQDRENLVIPRVLHLCYSDTSRVPCKVWDNIREVGNGYDIRIYDDEMCEDYIKRECGVQLANVYERIATPDHRRDMFKYCVLYNEGGVYVDLKTVPRVPFSEIFDHFAHNRLYTCLGARPHINQGILATYKRNPFIATLIQDFTTAPDSVTSVQSTKNMATFTYFTDKFYSNLKELLGFEPTPGVNYVPTTADPRSAGSARQMFVLFEERKELHISDKGYHKDGPWQVFGGGSDIAGCSDQRLFTTRYNDFPW